MTLFSFYAFSRQRNDNCILFTDNPDFFIPYLQGLPIVYESLTKERMREMRGEIDFLHRMKIAAIEHSMAMTRNNILYVDSDTFFTSSPEVILAELDEDTAFMHIHEYQFADVKVDGKGEYNRTIQQFISLLRSNQLYAASGTHFPVSLQDSSWNAGVIILHQRHALLLPDVYALTDQIFPATQHHASEQYAFSLVLQRSTRLKPCDSVVYHYWYRLKKQICDEFLIRNLSCSFKCLSLEDKLSRVHEWVTLLPTIFERHPIMIRDYAIQAFNAGKKWKGCRWSVRLLFKSPRLFFSFMRDIAYFIFKSGTFQNV